MPEEVTRVSAVPPFASVTEALEALKSAMSYLAAADAAGLPTPVQAQCLQGFEQAESIGTAARARFLSAFTRARGYCEDADYSPVMWLVNHTRITRGCAAGHVGWSRRADAHRLVTAVLAAGEVSASWARVICGWTGKLPEGCREEADRILLAAVRSGLDLRDITALAAEMDKKSRPQPDPDDDPGQVLEDRSVRLETTIGGAGVLAGELTPECAAVVRTVLEALSAPAGADDTRSHEQRYHDALAEAMRRLVAGGLVPDRAGQPARVWAHISLADLIDLDADSALQREWIARVRAQWAAARAAASVGGGDGAAWLEGAAAEGFACDASITPVVTGDINTAALEDLVRLCVELAGHGPGCGPGAEEASTGQEDTGTGQEDTGGRGEDTSTGQEDTSGGAEDTGGRGAGGRGAGGRGAGPVPPAEHGREALEMAIIGKAVDLLSGPGGLASFLRRREFGARFGGPSLPLDVGYSEDVPAGIRNAVRLRDQHCRFPGGCYQPAAACHVHHLTPKARGGKTSVKDCILLCPYHHLIVIHQQGWTLVLNPDGTTTAWNPGKTKVLHSHGPPARAG
jgi:hypothetical protein